MAKRLGIIKVTDEFIKLDKAYLIFSYKRLFVVCVNPCFETSNHLYKCTSPFFDLVEEGQVIPEYTLTVHEKYGRIVEVTMEKVL